MPCCWNDGSVRFGLGPDRLARCQSSRFGSFAGRPDLVLFQRTLASAQVPSPLIVRFAGWIFLQFWFCFRTNLADNLNFELCVWNFAFIFDKLTLSVEFWVEFWPPIYCFSSLFICFCFVSTLIEIIRNVLSYLLLYISFPRCFRASHFPDVDLSPSMTYLRWSIYLVVPFKSQ